MIGIETKSQSKNEIKSRLKQENSLDSTRWQKTGINLLRLWILHFLLFNSWFFYCESLHSLWVSFVCFECVICEFGCMRMIVIKNDFDACVWMNIPKIFFSVWMRNTLDAFLICEFLIFGSFCMNEEELKSDFGFFCMNEWRRFEEWFSLLDEWVKNDIYSISKSVTKFTWNHS